MFLLVIAEYYFFLIELSGKDNDSDFNSGLDFKEERDNRLERGR